MVVGVNGVNFQNVRKLVEVDQKNDQGVATLLPQKEMGRHVREISMKMRNAIPIPVQVSAQSIVGVGFF